MYDLFEIRKNPSIYITEKASERFSVLSFQKQQVSSDFGIVGIL